MLASASQEVRPDPMPLMNRASTPGSVVPMPSRTAASVRISPVARELWNSSNATGVVSGECGRHGNHRCAGRCLRLRHRAAFVGRYRIADSGRNNRLVPGRSADRWLHVPPQGRARSDTPYADRCCDT